MNSTPGFKAAIVGHIHVPTSLEIGDDTVQLDLFRAPGAKAHNFFNDERLNLVLQHKYDLVILWIGSNDIKESSSVKDLAKKIKQIVQAIEESCEAEVRTCTIEPRKPGRTGRFRVEQETYRKVAKAVNRKLQNKELRGKRVVDFGAKPFWDSLGWDGVHFNRQGREHVSAKLANCIREAYLDKRQIEAVGRPFRMSSSARWNTFQSSGSSS